MNYEVDSNFTLTINDLKLETDPGEYYCRSWTNETHFNIKSYYLTVGDDPQCTASQTQLRVGDVTSLTCESKYSGNNQPKLRWHRDEQPIASEDQFEIRTARRTLKLTASHTDDKMTYTCVMQFGDVVEECSKRLDVIYPVRDIEFVPTNRTFFHIGDQIMCTALGNPTPGIVLEPSTLTSRKLTNGSRVIDIEQTWRDKSAVTLRCNATNTVDGQTFTVSTNVTIAVIDRPSPTVSTGKPTPLTKSKIDTNPGIAVGAIVIVALSLLAIIGAVVLVRKHRDQQRRKAEAAKAEANKKQENQRRT
jgi:hypothetical protein